jgi:hypothetical protein
MPDFQTGTIRFPSEKSDDLGIIQWNIQNLDFLTGDFVDNLQTIINDGKGCYTRKSILSRPSRSRIFMSY